MIFTSFEYAGFLAAVVILNWLLPRVARPALLLAASFAFYWTWSPAATGILAAACVVAWSAGLVIPRLEGTRRAVLTGVSVAVAASSLVVFKLVEATGAASDDPGLIGQFVVPVGLSFFSFQTISYLIDVHRRTIEPSRSFIDVATFISFFPHLLAGPIVRAKKLIPAFHATPRWPDRVQWSEAAELILVGTFKKVALADPIFALSADAFLEPQQLGPLDGLLSLSAILLAGYFDVTAYIDIARGSAKLLGIDMQRNSLTPLLRSTGYADFWRRWQLTVMMWFRDYIYQPLRGEARSGRRESAALFGTFFALGLWHGLSPGWIVWGIASGTIIVIERNLQTARAAKRRARTKAARAARSRAMLPKPPNPYLSLASALGLVMLTFPLVAAPSLAESLDLYASVVRWDGSTPSADLVWMGALGLVALLVVDRREQRREALAGSPDPVNLRRAVAFGVMIAAIITFAGPAPQSFVYFNF